MPLIKPTKNPNWVNEPCSEKQVNFLLALVRDRIPEGWPDDATERVEMAQAWLSQADRTKGEVNEKITLTKSAPRDPASVRGNTSQGTGTAGPSAPYAGHPTGGRRPTGAGYRGTARSTSPSRATGYQPKAGEFYLIEVDRGDGTREQVLYKVRQAKQSGNIYVTRLTVQYKADGTTYGRFQYAPGELKNITDSSGLLTLEQAAKMGHAYGFCVICGTHLDKPESVKLGMGPHCAKKMGWK